MTNQQLKAHCEDVIANPQDHLDWVVDMARVALAALTEPVSPALRLPTREDFEVSCGGNLERNKWHPEYYSEHPTRSRWEAWQNAIAEVVRLNAPHTAPIEPICATGGAEWVKCSDRMPDEEGKDGRILVCCCGEVKTGFYDFLSKFSDADGYPLFTEVTHWMPLPAAPKP